MTNAKTSVRIARKVARGHRPEASVGGVLDEEAQEAASILRQAKRNPALREKAIGQLRERGIPFAPAVLAVQEVTETQAILEVTMAPPETPASVHPAQPEVPPEPAESAVPVMSVVLLAARFWGVINKKKS